MTDHGKPLFSFPDPRATQWAMLVLGLALLLAGSLVLLLLAFAPGSIEPGDAIGIGVMFGICVVGGAVLAALGVRDLVRSPEWHVTATHAVRMRGPKVVRAIVLRDQPSANLIPITRYGQLIGVRVNLGRSAIVAPTLDAAQGIVEAWRAARAR